MKYVKKYDLFLEAFQAKDKYEAITKIISYIKSSTGYNLYPYYETFYIHKKDIELDGQLYLTLNDPFSIRFNWIHGDNRAEIHSIDIWQSFEFDKKPDYTLELNGNSVIGSLKEVIKFINEPSKYVIESEKVKTTEEELELTESTDTDETEDSNENETEDNNLLKKQLDEYQTKLKRARNPEKKKEYQSMIDRLTAKISEDEYTETDSTKTVKSKLKDDVKLNIFRSIELMTTQVVKGRSNSLIITGMAGVGKCHGKGTKIMMFDCSIKNVEDIKVGDMVMGDDSKPRLVMSLGRGKDMMYKINPIKGDSFTCNSEHILSLVSNSGGDKNKIINISIIDYIKLPDSMKKRYKLYRVPLFFKEKEVKVDPYLIGLWIGDGSRNSGISITTVDNEIVNYLESVAVEENCSLFNNNHNNDKCPTYRITTNNKIGKGRHTNSLLTKFNHYDMINVEEKFIPNDYLHNSELNRKKLLAGLIDSDGYYYKHAKCYHISTKWHSLAKQIQFLCRSLGYACSISEKLVKNVNNIKGYNKIYYSINISGDFHDVPVLLKRKMAEKRIQVKNVLRTGFKIEEIGYDDYYGFTINDNHLYLLEDFTVTHNTNVVTETLASYGMAPGNAYIKISGDISTAGLYQTMFINRHKLILFDDCDGVFKDPDSMNMLKAALDTYEKREISNMKKTYYDSTGMTDLDIEIKYEQDPNKLPNQFLFDGKIIFISNLPESKFDKALISRSLHVDVNLTKQELLDRMRELVTKILPGESINKKFEALEYLNYLTENFKLKFDLNLRALVHAINIRCNPENEKDESIGGQSIPIWKLLIKQTMI